MSTIVGIVRHPTHLHLRMKSLTFQVVFGLIVWSVSSFGIKYFNYFETYAYIPQVCVVRPKKNSFVVVKILKRRLAI
jgi:hypothetical protein